MKKQRIRKKYYMVVCNSKNFGAFPFSKEGKRDAESYIETLRKKSKSKFKIKKH